jgi:hypothetical protein
MTEANAAKTANKEIMTGCRSITYWMAGHPAHYRVCWIPSKQTWYYIKLDPYAW